MNEPTQKDQLLSELKALEEKQTDIETKINSLKSSAKFNQKRINLVNEEISLLCAAES